MPNGIQSILDSLPIRIAELQKIKEILFANAVMLGEIPAPTFEETERAYGWRGLDILHFEGGGLTEKHTYAKASSPVVEKKKNSPRVRRAIDEGVLLEL